MAEPATRAACVAEIDRIIREITWHGQKQAIHTLMRPEIDLTMHETGEVYHQVTGEDPASATTWTKFGMGRERGDWRIRTETQTRVTCTAMGLGAVFAST